jgi:hypothetical protein
MSPASVNHVTSSPTPTSSEGIIDKFLDAIWMERGLSTNTLGAYRADLLALQRWLAQRDTSLMYATAPTCWPSSPIARRKAPSPVPRPGSFPASGASTASCFAKA